MDTELTLRRFALRARRIAAHSLAAQRERLAEMADFSWSGNLNLNGQIEFRRELPDEEIFESLAARLRPVILSSESVHYQKVLTALDTILQLPNEDAGELDEVREEVRQLRVAWSRHDSNKPVLHRYGVQQLKIDNSAASPQISDGQMALAWLYGDLVHVDVRGEKLDGTLVPIKERYAAAVSYFSDVAMLCARTFDVITNLAKRGLVDLGEDVMDTPVVVGSDELVATGVAYFAPPGTPMPELGPGKMTAPEGFRQLTPTELLRMDPKNHVQVRLEAEDGSLIAEYDAAVNGRQNNDKRLTWRVLVAGCMNYEVNFDLDGDQIELSDSRVSVAELSTNRMALDKARFERDLFRSAAMKFIVLGRDFLRLDLSSPTDKDLRDVDISIDSLEDLVAIEDITGHQIPLASGSVDNRQRADLRRFRLLWEGHVIVFRQGPVPTDAPSGRVPGCVVVPEGTRTIAGAEYPTPAFFLRHPQMIAESVEPIPDSDPPQDTMQMVIPSGEPFVCWVPDRAAVKDDSDLMAPIPWELSHFDTRPFLGSNWTDGQRLTV